MEEVEIEVETDVEVTDSEEEYQEPRTIEDDEDLGDIIEGDAADYGAMQFTDKT